MTESNTEATSKVKRVDGKVWIEGVPPLGWGKDKECTFAGALEAALTATKHPYRYSDIMGLTGLAFRVRWYQGDTGKRWCPSSPVGEFPEEIAAIQKATGWQFRDEVLLGEDNPQMERFAPDIVASLDAGKPVLACEEKLNMDVVYGCEDSGKTLLLRDYFKGESPLTLPASQLGPFLIFLRDHVEPLSSLAALAEALNIAARNWRRKPLSAERGKYRYGDAALSAWIEDLGQVDELTEKERELLFFVSWWNFDSLYDARVAAVSFLQESAAILKGESHEALKRAAALYQQEVNLLGSVFTEKNAFLGPWSEKSIKDWSADVQQSERGILAKARKIEMTAIAEMEKAVTAANA